MARFDNFVGIDLGGGKGKNTAVAHLRVTATGIEVVDFGTGKEAAWYDDRLLGYLQQVAGPSTCVAFDAPLTLPVCVRCTLPDCPTNDVCDVPMVSWFRTRMWPNGALDSKSGKKPRYTSYTQRATEVILHEGHDILPRETLGQGMGPLTARTAYLVRALQNQYRLNDNLIEVYPKATITLLFGKRIASQYKRSANGSRTRVEILNGLTELTFAPGVDRNVGLANDHKFDAILCAYTAFLYAQGKCLPPPDAEVARDGWIWAPAGPTREREAGRLTRE